VTSSAAEQDDAEDNERGNARRAEASTALALRLVTRLPTHSLQHVTCPGCTTLQCDISFAFIHESDAQ
jgi:hypothetical protein